MNSEQVSTNLSKPIRQLTAQDFINIIMLRSYGQYSEFYDAPNGQIVAIIIDNVELLENVLLGTGIEVNLPITIAGGIFKELHIKGALFNKNIYISGGKYLEGFRIFEGRFKEDFQVKGGCFQKNFDICNAIFDKNFIFNGGVFSKDTIVFESVIGGDFLIENGEFNGQFWISTGKFKKSVSFSGGNFNKLIITGGDFSHTFVISGGLFRQVVSISGNTFYFFVITGGIFNSQFSIYGADYNGEFTIDGGKFKDQVTVFNGNFGKPVTIKNGQFEQDFIINGGEFKDNVWIVGGNFNKYFKISGGNFLKYFDIQGGNINQQLVIEGGNFGENIAITGGIINEIIIRNLSLKTFILIKEEAYIRYISINDIIPKESFINIRSQVDKIEFCNVQNFGIIVLNEFQFRESEILNNIARERPELRIENSDLGKTIFINCDLSGFGLYFKSSKITDVFVTGTTMPKDIVNNDLKQQQLGYSQIKKIFEARGDKVEANHYYAREMDAYQATLSWRKRYEIGEKVNLTANKYSTFYGQSWGRGLWTTLLVSALFYIPYCWSLGYYPTYTSSTSIELFMNLSSYFLEFINPIHKADYVAEHLLDKSEHINGYSRTIEGLSRIFIAYFVYQLIQAFRKHGKANG